MGRDVLVKGLLALLAAAGTATAIAAQAGLAREAAVLGLEEPVPAALSTAGPRLNRDSLSLLATARNPFRLTRAPAPVVFDPVAQSLGGPPTPRPPRPLPILAGLLLGPSPGALIDGIPGTEGTRLLRIGESAGAFRVRMITPDSVVLEGADTTWSLKLRRTFQ